MTDKKAEQSVTFDVLIADLMLRVAVMEKIFLDKGLFTREEFLKISDEIALKAAKVVLEKANASISIDDFIENLEKKNK